MGEKHEQSVVGQVDIPQKMPRRGFLKLAPVATISALLTACGFGSSPSAPDGVAVSQAVGVAQDVPANQPVPAGPNELAIVPVPAEQKDQVLLAKEAAIKKEVEQLALQWAPTYAEIFRRPGVTEENLTYDIPMATVPETQAIRAEKDPALRFMRGVQYLGVQTKEELQSIPGKENPRYVVRGERYACNFYAVALVRLVTNNDVIGHRHNRRTGAPVNASREEQTSWSADAWQSWNEQNQEYDANMRTSWLLSEAAKDRGWEQVFTVEDLERRLREGEIIFGTKNPSKVIDPLDGHNFVLGLTPPLPSEPNGVPVISQATNNRFLVYHPIGHAMRTPTPDGEYLFFAVKMNYR